LKIGGYAIHAWEENDTKVAAVELRGVGPLYKHIPQKAFCMFISLLLVGDDQG